MFSGSRGFMVRPIRDVVGSVMPDIGDWSLRVLPPIQG